VNLIAAPSSWPGVGIGEPGIKVGKRRSAW
jgi:hypothetical protein